MPHGITAWRRSCLRAPSPQARASSRWAWRIASYYEQAERGSPPRLRLEKARIGRMRTLRLKGEREAARELADETEKRFELSVDAAREVAWEKLCLDLSPSFDLKAMLAVTGRGQSHYGAAYIVEAWLWTRAVASDVWKKRIVTIRYLARKKSGVKPQALGTVYDLALALERCEDPHAPLGKSLKDLGKHLGRADRILSLDHELLIWVAAARWLARIESHTQAALALGRYKVLSLMLSHGKHPDVLGCAADLLTAPWANGRELESEDFDASA
jgi:hypothetical protein